VPTSVFHRDAQVNQRIWGLEQERMRKNLALVEATVAHQHERDSAASSSNSGSGKGRV
jgi:hypothetical protein